MAERSEKALGGSYEDLTEAVRDAILDLDTFPAADWVWVRGTYPDHVVVSVEREGEASATYEVPYTVDKDGGIAIGEPSEVEVVETVEPKTANPDQTKAVVGFELKALKEVDDEVGGWQGTGTFSVWDVVDADGERVRKGAFKRSLAARLPKIKDHHGVTVGVGTAAREAEAGLEVDFRLYPTTAGRDLAILMQPVETEKGLSAPVEQGSIGFSVAPGGAKKNDDGTVDLVGLDLWEVSPVTFGANEHTRVGLKELKDMRVMDGPLDQYLVELSTTMAVGAREAKALYVRRKGEGRSLAERHIEAMADYAEAAGAALVETEYLLAKAGVRSTTRLRYIAQVIDRLQALVDGPAESDPPPAAGGDEEDEPAAKAAPAGGAAQGEPMAGADGGHQPPGSRDLEALWLKHAYRLHGEDNA